MQANTTANCLEVHLGAVTGPTFGLIDWSKIGDKVCIAEALKKIPIGLLNINQVLVVFGSTQKFNCPCGNQETICSFPNEFKEISKPEATHVCRAWFPAKSGHDMTWKEASISFGAAFFAGKYLIDKNKAQNEVTIAFASHQRKQWETVTVKRTEEGSLFHTLCVSGIDVTPDVLIDSAKKRLSPFYVKNDKGRACGLASGLHEIMECLTKNNMQLAVANFSRQRGQASKYGLQFIPFLPLYIGEYHNVIPVGEVLPKVRNKIKESEFKKYFEYWLELRQLFQFRTTTQRLIGYLGVGRRATNRWEDSPLGDYIGGWTFVRFPWEGDKIITDPVNFLTLEPEYPVQPFGQSHTGAFAAAIVKRGLSENSHTKTDDEQDTKKTEIELRGRRLWNMDEWIVKHIKESVKGGNNNQWNREITVSLYGNSSENENPNKYEITKGEIRAPVVKFGSINVYMDISS